MSDLSPTEATLLRLLFDLLSIDVAGHGEGWARPMDVGGRDGTWHSGALRKLEGQGLVVTKQRSGLTTRGSKVYRITNAGITALQSSKAPKDSGQREKS